MAKTLLIGTDNLIEVRGLRDATDDTYANSATVTGTLKDSGDSEVSGQTFPTTLSYVTGSDGVYQGVLEDGLSLTDGDSYSLEVTIDNGTDEIRFLTIAMTAAEDTA